MMLDAALFGGSSPRDREIADVLYGQLQMQNSQGESVYLFQKAKPRPQPQKNWWQFWK